MPAGTSQPKKAAPAPSPKSARELALQEVIRAHLLHRDDDTRPVLLFLAGANGSGKSTLFGDLDGLEKGRAFPFINADLLAALLSGIPHANQLTQCVADLMREHMVQHKATFATETVFSDEVGAKLAFLRAAADAGFRLVFVYVVLANVHLSRQRVAFRVREGMGHDVPADRLTRRFIASRENARRALAFVETGLVFDNSLAQLDKRMRLMAVVENGRLVHAAEPLPSYVGEILPMPVAGCRVPVPAGLIVRPRGRSLAQ